MYDHHLSPLWGRRVRGEEGGGSYLEPGGVDEARDDVDEGVELEHCSERRVRIGVVLVPLQVVGIHDFVNPENQTAKKKKTEKKRRGRQKKTPRSGTDT